MATTTTQYGVQVEVAVLLKEGSTYKRRSQRLQRAVSFLLFKKNCVGLNFPFKVENFLTDQDVDGESMFEDFGGHQLLNDHVENIRVEWSSFAPSRIFTTATKRFFFYKHLGMGIYNEESDTDEEDEEEESPGFNMMVLPNAELAGLWSVVLTQYTLHNCFKLMQNCRESLIFEVELKENLLANIQISLELASRQVDPLQVGKAFESEEIHAMSGEHIKAGPCAWPPWHWQDLPLSGARQQGFKTAVLSAK